MNNIRKFGIIAAFLAVVTILVPLPARLDTAFASETASDAIIQNARNEAEKLLSIRSASWLRFTDDWNAYLKAKKTNPNAVAPVFANKADTADTSPYEPSGLVTAGYLPASFPAGNYTVDASGNELSLTVTLDSTTASLVPNFLPMAEVSEGTVTFKITRPGATAEFNFFVEKNAVNAMGNGGTIEWFSGNGLVAANTLRGNTLSSQSGGPIAVSSPVNITGNTAVTGNLSATGTGTVTGTLTAGNLTTAGTVTGATGNFTNLGATRLAGNIDANTRNITNAGTVSGTSITASGAVTGATGDFSGTVTAGGLNLGSGSVTTTGTMSAGTMTATNGNFTNLGPTTLAGNMNAGGRNITNAGTVSGTSLTASGAVTGATGNFSGAVSTGALTASSLNAGSGAVTGGTGTFTTAKANTIEARTAGGNVTVNSNLALGSKTLSTTGAVSTGALTASSLNANSGAITTTGALKAGTTTLGTTTTGALTASSLNAGSGAITTTGALKAGTTTLGTTTTGALTASSLNAGSGAVTGGTGTFSGAVSTGTLTAANLNLGSGGSINLPGVGSSWLGGLSAARINQDLGGNTGSYYALLRQRHSSSTFNIGGINNQFGIYRYNNSQTTNNTASSFYMNAAGDMVASGKMTTPGIIVNTIESSAASISVTKALALGANALTTTGAGTFGTLNATNLGRSINAAGFNITGAGTLSATTLTASGTVTGATGTFTTLNATNLGRNINAAGYNITGAGTVSGTTGNFTNLNASSKVTASNVTTSTLTLGGQTGTSASPYNVYVENATNAAYATNAGTATTANNSLRLGGMTLEEIFDNLPPSGPSGIPTATAINNRTSGNTTLAVTSGKWYKIQMRSGAGAGYSGTTGSEEQGYASGFTVAGGNGIITTFYVRATASTTWSILFHVPTVVGGYPKGGTAVELKQGTTVIACLGAGGGSGLYQNTTGGNAGRPGASGGVAAGSAGGGYAAGTGGAAVSGTRVSSGNAGAGYTTGAKSASINGGGGGGSSYINSGYGNLMFEQPAAFSSVATPLISIWVYN